MKIKLKKSNDVVIEVTPREAGDYGILRIGGQERTSEDEYRLATEINEEIKRHVNNADTYVSQKRLFEDEDGDTHESLYELLYTNLSDEFIGYKYRYERPSDNGVGTSGTVYEFKELIELAFRNSNKFEVKSGTLTEEQKTLLDKVIQAAGDVEYVFV